VYPRERSFVRMKNVFFKYPILIMVPPVFEVKGEFEGERPPA